MRIKVRRGSRLWMVYEVSENYPPNDRSFRLQFFNTWHEAMTEAIYRSERIKTQCKQS